VEDDQTVCEHAARPDRCGFLGCCHTHPQLRRDKAQSWRAATFDIAFAGELSVAEEFEAARERRRRKVWRYVR
jgi:hypothetical protein